MRQTLYCGCIIDDDNTYIGVCKTHQNTRIAPAELISLKKHIEELEDALRALAQKVHTAGYDMVIAPEELEEARRLLAGEARSASKKASG
jgi:seryl-tRNA synthetase